MCTHGTPLLFGSIVAVPRIQEEVSFSLSEATDTESLTNEQYVGSVMCQSERDHHLIQRDPHSRRSHFALCMYAKSAGKVWIIPLQPRQLCFLFHASNPQKTQKKKILRIPNNGVTMVLSVDGAHKSHLFRLTGLDHVLLADLLHHFLGLLAV